MQFKDVKTGYQVYILHQTDEPYVTRGKVSSMPTMHINQSGTYSINATAQMMVDVTIEDEGVTKTYTIPETSSITYGANVVLATERELLVKEVENLKSASEEHLRSTAKHEKLAACYDKLLLDLNPAFREKQETEARFGKIEGDVTEIKGMIGDLIKKLS